MRQHRKSGQGLPAVFAMPLAMAVSSSIALLLALTGDGWRDVVSWIGLAAPILTIGWAMRFRRS